MSSQDQTPLLCARYRSPTCDGKSFGKALQSLTTSSRESQDSAGSLIKDSIAAKVAYLSALRSAVTHLQEEVNIFLTAKMDEEKADAKSGPGNRGTSTKEDYEEDDGAEEMEAEA